MKNPKLLSNGELVEQLKSLANEERRLGLEILHFLREVEKRRLYADRFSSLHEFAVKELRYSDGAAYRRIQSMRLLKDLPEVEAEIKSGTLTLSTASQLQSFFKHEEKKKTPYSVTQKKELLQEIKGNSARQTEALLAEKAPEMKIQIPAMLSSLKCWLMSRSKNSTLQKSQSVNLRELLRRKSACKLTDPPLKTDAWFGRRLGVDVSIATLKPVLGATHRTHFRWTTKPPMQKAARRSSAISSSFAPSIIERRISEILGFTGRNLKRSWKPVR